jgi:hypothetical protein
MQVIKTSYETLVKYTKRPEHESNIEPLRNYIAPIGKETLKSQLLSQTAGFFPLHPESRERTKTLHVLSVATTWA